MTRNFVLATVLWAALSLPVEAQQKLQQASRVQPAHTSESQTVRSEDAGLAKAWGLRDDEFARYRELMQGPLGSYSPQLDPLSALGIEAHSNEERQRYAELQVQVEARRVEKLLAYQRAYDEAWQRLNPGLQRVSMPDTPGAIAMADSGRIAVFVKDGCEPCEQLVRNLQASGVAFDLYMVGSRQDDARIRTWAKRAQIDAVRVRGGSITLNHDSGRWLSLGLAGDLPAVVRQVNGQWQRQP